MTATRMAVCGGILADSQAPVCHRHITVLFPKAHAHQLAGHRLRLARCSCQQRHRRAVSKQVCRAASATEEVVDVEGVVVEGNKIPVTVITGFLGSGKTTLLNALLKQDHGRRIAVIENEFGAIDIDSELVAFKESTDGKGQIMMLNNGCLCCTVMGDLLDMLQDLMERRDQFDHIVIETTGLADPKPIIETFVAYPPVAEHYSLDGVLTLVDAKHVMRHLDEVKPEGIVNEALAQVAYADRIILNKTDLVSERDVEEVQSRLASINGLAQVVRAQQADVSADYVLGIGGFDLDRIADEATSAVGAAQVVEELEASAHDHHHDHDHEHEHDHEHNHGDAHAHSHAHDDHTHGEAAPSAAHSHVHEEGSHAHGHEHAAGHDHGHAHGHDHHGHSHTHDDSVTSVSFELDGDLDLDKVNDWMEDLLFSCSEDLFRFKGVLAIDGWPDRFIFQGVHAVFDGTPGKPWKEGERHRSRMVFIGRDLDERILREGFSKCLV